MSGLESEVSRLYEILGHPMRRQIIRILGEAKRASFTDLKSTLKVSVGTLYYNLDLLEDLVAQDREKKYVLTPKGEMAFDSLSKAKRNLPPLGWRLKGGRVGLEP